MNKDTILTNQFSEEVFNITYRYNNESVDDMFVRVAENLASIETDKEFWKKEFYEALTDFKFVPGGRILSNAGCDYKSTTYINCYVDGFIGNNLDSMDSIMDALKRQATILKSEGGYGFCVDPLRPRGGYVMGIGNESPGPIKMLEMWDTQSDVITAGSGKVSSKKGAKSKIRKGAQMVTMSCWNPSIEEFITVKQTKNKLTKFNMSVLVTDKFMEAVKSHSKWDLIFPDFDDNKAFYDEFWDGNIEKWIQNGGKVKVYKTYTDANELWNIITKSTYTRNEPGVLFVDRINSLNNLYYNEHITSTNPCGEQALPIGGVCLLGSINLTQFIKDDDWDFAKLEKYIPAIVRMLDNVNDITYVPLEIEKENLLNKRRLGIGVFGFASAILMLGIRYGSIECSNKIHSLMKFISNKAYQSSALLAKEKGSFLLFDKDKYLQSNFVKRLDDETIEMIKEYGIRNSHLLSIQPTGNTSILANVISSGLEPIFLPEYTRTSITTDDIERPKIDWSAKTVDSNLWHWIKEGDVDLLKAEINGCVYKLDQTRGLLKESNVIDYGIKYLRDNKKEHLIETSLACTDVLDVDDHISVLDAFTYYLDSSCSKTINLPNDYPYENFKDVYLTCYDTGNIKGVTTYRSGTMSEVLSATTNKPKIQKPRAKEIDCDIHYIQALGKKWYVIVGLIDDRPYEIFTLLEKNVEIPSGKKNGKLIKIRSGVYDLKINGSFLFRDISQFFEQPDDETDTRLISLLLREGVSIMKICEQLEKSKGNITSLSKAVSRTLKKHYISDSEMNDKGDICPECGGKLIYTNGCSNCPDCSYSKCS